MDILSREADSLVDLLHQRSKVLVEFIGGYANTPEFIPAID